MSLEDEVNEIMRQALMRTPHALERAIRAQDGPEPSISDEEAIEFLQGFTLGLRQAILLLARRLDEIDDTPSGL